MIHWSPPKVLLAGRLLHNPLIVGRSSSEFSGVHSESTIIYNISFVIGDLMFVKLFQIKVVINLSLNVTGQMGKNE